MTTVTFEQNGEEFSIQGDLSDAPTCNRGLSMMEELRSQMSQRSDVELSNPFEKIPAGRYKDVFNVIEDVELQGMLMMFSFLHNCGENELVKHSEDNDHTLS